MPENYYTPQEVAAALRVKLQTVYDWIAAGKLRAIKVGGRFRISRGAYDDFIRCAQVKGG